MIDLYCCDELVIIGAYTCYSSDVKAIIMMAISHNLIMVIVTKIMTMMAMMMMMMAMM